MALHYVMLKILILPSGWKWCHRLYTFSAHQLIQIFLMPKNTLSH